MACRSRTTHHQKGGYVCVYGCSTSLMKSVSENTPCRVFSPVQSPEARTHAPSTGNRELPSTWLPWPGEGLWSRLGWFGGSLRNGVKVISQIKACCRRKGIVKTPIACGTVRGFQQRLLHGSSAAALAQLLEATSTCVSVELKRASSCSAAQSQPYCRAFRSAWTLFNSSSLSCGSCAPQD